MRTLLAGLLLFTIPLQALAQPDSEPAEVPSTASEAPEAFFHTKPWSLEVGGGLGFAHTRLNYHLPMAREFSVYLEYSPLEAEYDLFPGRFQTAILGARWYDQKGLGGFMPYLTLGAGASFNPTGADHPTDPGRTGTGFNLPVFPFVGVGGDYLLFPHVGLNAQVGSTYFLLNGVRAELNLKVVF